VNNPVFESNAGFGPIPSGRYEILYIDPNYGYRLDSLDDGLIRDDFDDRFGRSLYRLHRGTISKGCITVDKNKYSKDWKKIDNLIKSTRTTVVPDVPSIFSSNSSLLNGLKLYVGYFKWSFGGPSATQ
jgi:Protein of unknown function (DUF2778)